MTDREAIKMALKWMEATHHTAMTTYSDEAYKKHCKVERELRQALAQEQTKCPRCGEENPAEIHTCSPQVAQEPIAYLCENAVGYKYLRWKKPTSHYKPIALYTATPIKPWVGLTNEERNAYNNRLSGSGVAEEIDALLKEKNGAT